jgi:hypothetical protein
MLVDIPARTFRQGEPVRTNLPATCCSADTEQIFIELGSRETISPSLRSLVKLLLTVSTVIPKKSAISCRGIGM